MADAPMTVVETGEFLKHAKGLMTESEREALIAFVGENPEAGQIIPETGGVRKIRWALAGMGRRGGARVIYYYHSPLLPLFLLPVYAKNRKTNVSKAECNEMKRLVPQLATEYRRRA